MCIYIYICVCVCVYTGMNPPQFGRHSTLIRKCPYASSNANIREYKMHDVLATVLPPPSARTRAVTGATQRAEPRAPSPDLRATKRSRITCSVATPTLGSLPRPSCLQAKQKTTSQTSRTKQTNETDWQKTSTKPSKAKNQDRQSKDKQRNKSTT